MKRKLSVVIITLNEERNIARCIQSVIGIADEVIVVDSLSSDATASIAKSLGARVIEQPFLGHIEQKNFAVSHAAHEVILSLDADEALSERLKESIKDVLENFEADAYSMNRLTNYCGRWIRHGGWYPDVKIRMFRKGLGRWKGTNPHDRFELDSGLKVKHLKGDLLHYSYYSIEEHKAQIVKFTDIAAEAKYQKGVRSNPVKMLVKPVAKFVKNYLIRQGFRDGHYGWIIATSSAYATYLKYKKLWRRQRNPA